MAINGMLGFGGLYNYRPMNIPSVDVNQVKQAEVNEKPEAAEVVSAPSLETPAWEDNRTKAADLDNISINFNTGDDFSYIGSESEIGKLDIDKAISDMRKDKILEDYQYFVGSTQNTQNNEDGMVFLKY